MNPFRAGYPFAVRLAFLIVLTAGFEARPQVSTDEERERYQRWEERRRNAHMLRLQRSRSVPLEEIKEDLEWLDANTTTTRRYGRQERTVTFHYTGSGINGVGWHELVQVSPTDTGRVEIKWMTLGGNVRIEYLTPRGNVSSTAVARRVYDIARTKGNDVIRIGPEQPDRDQQFVAYHEGQKSYEQRVTENLVEGAFKVNWEAIFGFAGAPARIVGGSDDGYSIVDLRLKLTTAPGRYANDNPLVMELALPAMMTVTLPPHSYDPPAAQATPGRYTVKFWAPGFGIQYRLLKYADQSGDVPLRFQVPLGLHVGALLLPASSDIGEETSDYRTVTPYIDSHLRFMNFHANASVSAHLYFSFVGVGASLGLQYVNIASSDKDLSFWTGQRFGQPGAYADSRFVMGSALPVVPYASLKLLAYFGGD